MDYENLKSRSGINCVAHYAARYAAIYVETAPRVAPAARRSFGGFCLGLILTLAAFAPVRAQSKIDVRLPVEIIVAKSLINLGDIAEISGDAARVERLKNISFGYAPNVGAVRELSRERILEALATAGFAPTEFRLESPPIVRLRRAAQEISREMIRQAVENAVRNQISADTSDARLIKLDLPEKVLAPPGTVEIRTKLAGVRNLFAPFSASVEIRVDDVLFRRLAVNAEIEAFADVFVAVRELSANTKINAADLRLEKRRLEKPVSDYLRDADRLRGAVLVKAVAGGAAVTSASIIAGIVIRAGDPVRIVGISERLQIIVSGEARAAGRIGDRIAVRNLQSNAVLQAVVTDEGTVKIIF